MRDQKGPCTWAAAYRELAAIEEASQEILACWRIRIEEAVAQADCCLEVVEILRTFRARAWRRAVCEHERGGLTRRRSRQLELF